MRIYDGRLGRFLSVDPLSAKFAWNSTYAFAENRPIDGTDLDGKEWNTLKKYDPLTGIFTIDNVVKIKVVNNTVLIDQSNIGPILESWKCEAEHSFTQFDKDKNIQYNMKIEYEIVSQKDVKASDFWMELADMDVTNPENILGKVKAIGNTQANKIKMIVEYKLDDSYGFFDGLYDTQANTFGGELGHTGGLYHPYSNEAANIPEIKSQNKRSSMTDNLMYHESGSTGSRLENVQLRKVSETASQQQANPSEAKGTYTTDDEKP